MQSSPWSDLQFFLEVQRAGSLSGAGRVLGVYPSTVGRRIAALEQAMDAVLFHRTPDGLVATSAAAAMIGNAEQMERCAQLIAQGLSGQSAELRGNVRVAVTSDFATYFLAARLGAFRQLHPDIELDLVTSTGRADITRGEADIAVRFARPKDGAPVDGHQRDAVVGRMLSEIGFALYASRDYLERRGTPAQLADLAQHDIVVPSAGQRWLPGYEWVEHNASAARVAVRTDSIAAMVSATRAGSGISALPSFMAIPHADLQQIPLGGVIASRRAWLLMPRDLRRVARVRAVADYITEVVTGSSELLAAGVRPNAGT